MSAWTQLIESGPALLILVLAVTSQVAAAPLDELEQQSSEIKYYPVADATGCYYNFEHYDEGDRIITNEPCLNCTCHNRMLMCYLRVCPFTKAIGQDCKVEKRPEQCCPVITCPEVPVHLLPHDATTPSTAVGHLNEYGCSIDNLFYADGAKVPSNPNNPCEVCYCIRNKTACIIQECTLTGKVVEGCRPVYVDGVCCPVRYDCEHPELETTSRPRIATTTTTLPPTSAPTDCIFDNEIYADGALVKNDIPCEKCYCMRGDIVCAVQECGPTPLDKVNCTALPTKEGQCCPDTYECENISEEDLTTLTYSETPTTQPTLASFSESSTSSPEDLLTTSQGEEEFSPETGKHVMESTTQQIDESKATESVTESATVEGFTTRITEAVDAITSRVTDIVEVITSVIPGSSQQTTRQPESQSVVTESEPSAETEKVYTVDRETSTENKVEIEQTETTEVEPSLEEEKYHPVDQQSVTEDKVEKATEETEMAETEPSVETETSHIFDQQLVTENKVEEVTDQLLVGTERTSQETEAPESEISSVTETATEEHELENGPFEIVHDDHEEDPIHEHEQENEIIEGSGKPIEEYPTTSTPIHATQELTTQQMDDLTEANKEQEQVTEEGSGVPEEQTSLSVEEIQPTTLSNIEIYTDGSKAGTIPGEGLDTIIPLEPDSHVKVTVPTQIITEQPVTSDTIDSEKRLDSTTISVITDAEAQETVHPQHEESTEQNKLETSVLPEIVTIINEQEQTYPQSEEEVIGAKRTEEPLEKITTTESAVHITTKVEEKATELIPSIIETQTTLKPVEKETSSSDESATEIVETTISPKEHKPVSGEDEEKSISTTEKEELEIITEIAIKGTERPESMDHISETVSLLPTSQTEKSVDTETTETSTIVELETEVHLTEKSVDKEAPQTTVPSKPEAEERLTEKTTDVETTEATTTSQSETEVKPTEESLDKEITAVSTPKLETEIELTEKPLDKEATQKGIDSGTDQPSGTTQPSIVESELTTKTTEVDTNIPVSSDEPEICSDEECKSVQDKTEVAINVEEGCTKEKCTPQEQLPNSAYGTETSVPVVCDSEHGCAPSLPQQGGKESETPDECNEDGCTPRISDKDNSTIVGCSTEEGCIPDKKTGSPMTDKEAEGSPICDPEFGCNEETSEVIPVEPEITDIYQLPKLTTASTSEIIAPGIKEQPQEEVTEVQPEGTPQTPEDLEGSGESVGSLITEDYGTTTAQPATIVSESVPEEEATEVSLTEIQPEKSTDVITDLGQVTAEFDNTTPRPTTEENKTTLESELSVSPIGTESTVHPENDRISTTESQTEDITEHIKETKIPIVSDISLIPEELTEDGIINTTDQIDTKDNEPTVPTEPDIVLETTERKKEDEATEGVPIEGIVKTDVDISVTTEVPASAPEREKEPSEGTPEVTEHIPTSKSETGDTTESVKEGETIIPQESEITAKIPTESSMGTFTESQATDTVSDKDNYGTELNKIEDTDRPEVSEVTEPSSSGLETSEVTTIETSEKSFTQIPEITEYPPERTATEISQSPVKTEVPVPVTESDSDITSESEDHGIPGEGNCLVDGQTYKNNSFVPPINQCQTSCKCLSSILQCESIPCAPPPNNLQCMPIFHSPDACCPVYSCSIPGVTSMESDSHVVETTTINREIEPSATIKGEETVTPDEVSSVTTDQVITESEKELPAKPDQEIPSVTTEQIITESETKLSIKPTQEVPSETSEPVTIEGESQVTVTPEKEPGETTGIIKVDLENGLPANPTEEIPGEITEKGEGLTTVKTIITDENEIVPKPVEEEPSEVTEHIPISESVTTDTTEQIVTEKEKQLPAKSTEEESNVTTEFTDKEPDATTEQMIESVNELLTRPTEKQQGVTQQVITEGQTELPTSSESAEEEHGVTTQEVTEPNTDLPLKPVQEEPTERVITDSEKELPMKIDQELPSETTEQIITETENVLPDKTTGEIPNAVTEQIITEESESDKSGQKQTTEETTQAILSIPQEQSVTESEILTVTEIETKLELIPESQTIASEIVDTVPNQSFTTIPPKEIPSQDEIENEILEETVHPQLCGSEGCASLKPTEVSSVESITDGIVPIEPEHPEIIKEVMSGIDETLSETTSATVSEISQHIPHQTERIDTSEDEGTTAGSVTVSEETDRTTKIPVDGDIVVPVTVKAQGETEITEIIATETSKTTSTEETISTKEPKSPEEIAAIPEMEEPVTTATETILKEVSPNDFEQTTLSSGTEIETTEELVNVDNVEPTSENELIQSPPYEENSVPTEIIPTEKSVVDYETTTPIIEPIEKVETTQTSQTLPVSLAEGETPEKPDDSTLPSITEIVPETTSKNLLAEITPEGTVLLQTDSVPEELVTHIPTIEEQSSDSEQDKLATESTTPVNEILEGSTNKLKEIDTETVTDVSQESSDVTIVPQKPEGEGITLPSAGENNISESEHSTTVKAIVGSTELSSSTESEESIEKTESSLISKETEGTTKPESEDVTEKEETVYTSPQITTQIPSNDSELYTSGPKIELSTTKSVEGELSTSVPATSTSTSEPSPVYTQPTSAVPPHAGAPIPSHDIPGEQVPELPDYQSPVDDYEDEEQSPLGPGTCRYGGKVYVSAQQIPRDDPCDFCFCFRSDIICLQQSCPPPIPRCHEEPIRGFCCPRYECPVGMATAVNVTTSTTTTTTTLPPHFFAHAYKDRVMKSGCQIKGRAYQVGDVIPSASGPCLHCTCGGDGEMKCDPKACSPEPMLRQMIAAAVSRRRR